MQVPPAANEAGFIAQHLSEWKASARRQPARAARTLPQARGSSPRLWIDLE
jgi:hypothetical protein